MPSKRKSTSDRKSKEHHHSRNRRNRGYNNNINELVEAIYYVDHMRPHTNNVPLFIPTPYYEPSHSNRKPISPVRYINPSAAPVFPDRKNPAQLKIGQLYFLAEDKPNTSNVNPVFLQDAHSISVNKNKPMSKGNPRERISNKIQHEKPGSVNLVSECYYLPNQTTAADVVNTWRSKVRAENILIDTPTQYEYEISTSNRISSSLSERLWLESNETISEHGNLTSIQRKHSWNKNDDSVFPEPLRDLTVMRVVDRNDIDQGAGLYDLCPPNINRYSRSRPKTHQSTEASKLYRVKKCNRETSGKNRGRDHTKICIEMPVEISNLGKEKPVCNSLKNRYRCYPRKMNIKTDCNKRLYSTNNRCTKRSSVKARNFRGMTTEDSINDLYRKIKDIQSSLGVSSVHGLLSRNAEDEAKAMAYPVPFEQSFYPKQLGYSCSDMACTSTITSPINFKTIENTGSCCCSCCCQCTNKVEKGLCSPILTRDIDTITEFPNNLNQCPCSCRIELGNPNDGIHYVKMYYPQVNTPLQSGRGLLCVEPLPPSNENIKILIDQETGTQSPSLSQIKIPSSLSREEICNRPCNCPNNPNEKVATDFFSGEPATKETRFCVTKDNSTQCSPQDLCGSYGKKCPCIPNKETDKTKSTGVQTSSSKDALEQTNNYPCSTNPCNCDLSKDISDIMGKIEDDIILKLTHKKLILKSSAPESSAEDIQDRRETRKSSKFLRRRSGNAGKKRMSMRKDSMFNSSSRPIVIDNSDVVIQNEPMDQQGGPEYAMGDDPGTRASSFQSGRESMFGRKRSSMYTPPFLVNRSSRPSMFGGPSMYTPAPRRSLFMGGRPSRMYGPGYGPQSPFSQYPRPGYPGYQGYGGYGGYPGYAGYFGYPGPSPTITNILTAFPSIDEDDIEAAKDTSEFSKDDIPSNNKLENDTLSWKSIDDTISWKSIDDTISWKSIIEKNDGIKKKNNYSHLIKKTKLFRPKKHGNVLLKRRKKCKNTSNEENKESLNILTDKDNLLKEVPVEKQMSLKDVKTEEKNI